MLIKHRFRLVFAILAGLTALGTCPVFGVDGKVLPGHVPREVSRLQPVGRLPAASELRLGIGVPLRDPEGLKQFVAEVSDPARPNYRKYLTPAEFAARFSATEADYAKVKNFALANGFKIIGTRDSRLLLEVSAQATDVERVFHIKLQKFQHPTEAREFFAPDLEPTVDVALPVADVQGLSDFYRPRPKLHKLDSKSLVPKSGSASGGSYIGDDFRRAYAPGTTLTGAGQMVGLFQLDGYYANDIAAYAQQAGGGRANIQVQAIVVGSTNWSVGVNGGNGEVSLDIEMAMAMAPGLSKILVFEGPSSAWPNSILSTMAASNMVKNLSCSWGWGGGPSATTDAIFQQMAAQGQSFFNASGDSDAFTLGASSVNGVDNTSLPNAPSGSSYITQVGGTTLTTGTSASYASETVWNWNNSGQPGVGSSGGVSSYYSIPSWQNGVSTLASTTQRNIPDVALTADNVYVVSGGSGVGSGGWGGTSCAAPLWAGFMALVNQQAASLGNPAAGFINPAIYVIGKGANVNYTYAACFHDTTSGNNYWSSSPSQYAAAAGYDLCTGWGTPSGMNLINALAGAGDSLGISPGAGYSFGGATGGPFSPAAGVLQLTNSGAAAFSWSLVNTSAWLAVSLSSGTLAAHAATNLSVGLAAAANDLAAGNYSASLAFSNQTTHLTQFVPLALQIVQPLSVSPIKGFTATGPVGGPFAPNSQVFALTNLGAGTVDWSAVSTAAWLTASPSAGSLAPGGQATVTVSLSAALNSMPMAAYSANIVFTNPGGVAATVPFVVSVGQPLVQNGGFETGDFTGWTQSGNTAYTLASTTATYVHGGTHGAQVGPSGSLGYLSQNLPTAPGQNYLVSLWVRNPAGTTPAIFQVQWNGVTLYNQTSFTVTAWTNLHWLVSATSSATTLQLGFQDNPSYFGIDDVSVTPLAPATMQTVRSANNFQLAWNTTIGAAYQVQYKTNLLQASWLNLGSAITATTNTLTINDTNALKLAPQRYYRLLVLP